MNDKVSTLLECSRIFSLPMTIMSWLVVFTYSVINSGNGWYGILCLAAICLVHMGTNVLDDYFDYKSLIKQVGFDKKEYLKNTQKTKCRYLVSGVLKESQILALAGVYFLIASVIGLFFYIKCGAPVIKFALAGGFIALFYSILSKIRLSEVAVALAYGPILFGGVNYVMTKTISWEVFVLSVPTMIMTVILLYIHTVMDFDFDLKEGHYTIANAFDSQLDSLIVLKIFIILAYVSLFGICIFDISDWQVLIPLITIPLSMDLFKSMTDFSLDNKSVPHHKWYHYPMENMERIEKLGAESFMIRMYQSRNLMIYFAIFLAIGLVLANI